MKETLKSIFILLLVATSSNLLNAQCLPGEVTLELTVNTDDYGYEGYWEIVPTGNACGVGTVVFGGNATVGCNGGGSQNQTPGGYADNSTIIVDSICLIEGASYDLIYVDDWGDGGFEFEISVNGFNVNNFHAVTGSNLTYQFEASEPFAYDLGIYSLSSPFVYDYLGSKIIAGTYFNYGSAMVTSFDLNYQIDNDPIQTTQVSGINIQNFEAATFSHPTAWNATIGDYLLKVWITNINGNPDMNNNNDTLQVNIEIGVGTPNIIDNYVNASTNIEQVASSSNSVITPTDLDFHPVLSKNQLWILNKRTESTGGNTVIIDNAGEPNQSSIVKTDGNAWHFMSLPTGIAFSTNGNFATSSGVFDANHDGGDPFTGPALWSSDLSIYAEPSGGNGSHLDMLHVSPYSQGIASEKDNVFWVFDGHSNDIVRYDFVDDHGPGNSFHGDGIIHRYNDFSVAKDPNNKVVSHLVVNDNWVYVVDYGNQRVFRIELNTGTLGATPSFGPFESVAEYKYVTGYNVETLVDSGLVEPAGIDVIDNRMIVSDYSNGEIIIYDISVVPALELSRISTLAQGIMGIKIGPDGRIWYVDYDANTVNVINAVGLGSEDNDLLSKVLVYPNPSSGTVTVQIDSKNMGDFEIEVLNSRGQLVLEKVSETRNNINFTIQNSGLYLINVFNDGRKFHQEKIIIY